MTSAGDVSVAVAGVGDRLEQAGLSTLAHIGGEIALAEGDPGQAAAQLARSVELLQGIRCPFEQALTQLRWGGALARDGDREQAIDVITSAYRTVDMHLRNLLRKLDCTSRTAAVRRAVEIGILDGASQPSRST